MTVQGLACGEFVRRQATHRRGQRNECPSIGTQRIIRHMTQKTQSACRALWVIVSVVGLVIALGDKALTHDPYDEGDRHDTVVAS